MFYIDAYVCDQFENFKTLFFASTQDELKQVCLNDFRESVEKYHGFAAENGGGTRESLVPLLNPRNLGIPVHYALPCFRIRSPHNAPVGEQEGMQKDHHHFYLWEYGVFNLYNALKKMLDDIQTFKDVEECRTAFRLKSENQSKIKNFMGLEILKPAAAKVYSRLNLYLNAFEHREMRLYAVLVEEVFEQFKKSGSREMKMVRSILCDMERRAIEKDDRAKSYICKEARFPEGFELDQVLRKSILSDVIQVDLEEDDVSKRGQKILAAIQAGENTEEAQFFKVLVKMISLRANGFYYGGNYCGLFSKHSMGYYKQRRVVAQKLLGHLHTIDSETYEFIVSKLREKKISEPKIPFFEETEFEQLMLGETNPQPSLTIRSA